jgi:hypothetical protein
MLGSLIAIRDLERSDTTKFRSQIASAESVNGKKKPRKARAALGKSYCSADDLGFPLCTR